MDVRVTSTGKIWRQVDSGIAAMLIDALPSVFEKYEDINPAPKPGTLKPREDKWSVGQSPYSGVVSILLIRKTGEHMPYAGPPENARATYKRCGVELPEDIERMYERRWESEHRPVKGLSDADRARGLQ